MTVDQDDPASHSQVTIPLGVVLARILVVSGMGFAGALAIFFLVGGFWIVALISALATVIFLFLMFAVERFAGG